MKISSIAGELRPRNGPNQPHLYHGGLEKDVESILANGLLISRACQMWDCSAPGAIYLTESPRAAIQWMRHALERRPDLEGERLARFQIDIAELDARLLEPDTIGMMGDWRYKGDISASAIKQIR